jgi:nicotinamide mononucleotide transporter
MDPIELIAAILSALGVWLAAARRASSWPVSLAASLLYGWVFVDARLYSDMLLQGAFVIMIIYGWIRWSRHLGSDRRVRIAPLAPRTGAWHVAVGIAGALALGYVMQRFTDAALPWLDAGLAAFSMVGTWWEARRHLAAWWLWIVVDTIYIGEYVYKDLRITAVLYAAFVVLAVIGLRRWQHAAAMRPAAN